MIMPLYKLTATHALELINNNTISVEAYAKSLLDRIEERDPTVKAWAYLDPASILSQAQSLDKIPVKERGRLHGVPIGIKDIMNTKDMPTQYGSPIYQGHRPGSDSSAVAILRSAGALIFGKTTTTEFAATNSGPETTNPHDPNRTPGGSSCGSAAAVADLQIPLSLGAQTGGSVIRPASFTGIFAMKPTFSAISVEGQKTFAPTFDTFGFFGCSVDDLELLADVLCLKDDEAPIDTPLNDISVAIIKTPMWSAAGPGTVSAIDKTIAILRSNGINVEEVTFPAEVNDADELKRVQRFIILGEGQASFLREYRLDKAKLSNEIRDMVENTSHLTNAAKTEATYKYCKMRESIDSLVKRYTVVITPSVIDEAPIGLGDMGRATFNTLWTGFHVPVINIPAFVGENGMPVSISLVGPRYRDQQLLLTSQVISKILMAKGYWKL
ncbi:amidase [Fusarium langsethiae]|uniref:Amidase n=1 Tax=Fusarium langsethiae TaxID=179993 RepID=A0A0N0DB21_FUSLA|nr:amidase [Fusarium langsethiae]GKU08423.1 unnamed protein product [Fusarium langsethiae]